jgi:hypothetical protein
MPLDGTLGLVSNLISDGNPWALLRASSDWPDGSLDTWIQA